MMHPGIDEEWAEFERVLRPALVAKARLFMPEACARLEPGELGRIIQGVMVDTFLTATGEIPLETWANLDSILNRSARISGLAASDERPPAAVIEADPAWMDTTGDEVPLWALVVLFVVVGAVLVLGTLAGIGALW